ncbi:ADP-ribose-binding protein [candidate division WOR-3 bacterium]|nr:ADP-ribose-binding protein [candidate division WOR-3 bacterium]
MKEIFGDLFEQKDADVICITTNGFVKRDGSCVVGRGCAKEADRRWNCSKTLGELIRHWENIPVIFYRTNDYTVVSFPVKHNWWEKADLDLIRKSANLLVGLADFYDWKKVVLPRPGCGNGRLDWKDVKPVLEPILDDRFYVITNKKGCE